MSLIPAVVARDADPPKIIGAGSRRFRVGSRLHRGRETSIYRALEIGDGAPVALKRVRNCMSNDANAQARIEYEAAVLGRLDHPAVVKGLGATERVDDTAFLVMEYIDGIDLRQLLQRSADAISATPGQIARIGAACAEALVVCHEARWNDYELCITHGAVDPGNVMLTRSGQVKLIDFGNALWSLRDESRRHDPEIALNVRRDVVDLGLLLYQLGIGSALPDDRRPDSDDVRVLTSLPKTLRQIIGRTLESGPVPWYQSMRELYEDLMEALLAWNAGDDAAELGALAERLPRVPSISKSWFSGVEPDGDRQTECYLDSAESRRALRYSDAAALNSWMEAYQRTRGAR